MTPRQILRGSTYLVSRRCTQRQFLLKPTPLPARRRALGWRRRARTSIISTKMRDRPYFLWDLQVTEAQFHERLRHPDPRCRAQWQGRLMREARPDEVWAYLTLEEIVRDWAYLRRYLGRRRRFWEFLLDGWRADGLLSA